MQEADLRRDTTIDHPVGHELSDLRPGYIALFGIALTAVIVAAAVITTLLIHFKAAEQSRQETPIPRLAGEREATPEPRLQLDANKELRQMRAAEDAALNSYGWVDRSSGSVRIPIERAMEILAKKGLPARKQEEKAR
ncbi:MAG: hypothetical protein ABW172_13970 [Candidatus Binatia bacterium]|jgi:hypothetical protein